MSASMITTDMVGELEFIEGTPGRDSESRPFLRSSNTILIRLYISHTLSAWNSRTFEFGAVLFIASLFPDTLLYASCYALLRSAAAILLSSWIGDLMDRLNRLTTVRRSIVWQRMSVILSCILFLVMISFRSSVLVVLSCFAVTVLLACVEKLAFVVSTIAVERDWVIVVAESIGAERQSLNATMRRIDLTCKLFAPLFISFIESFSTAMAIWTVLGLSMGSVLVEYFTVAQVYEAVPQLNRSVSDSLNTRDDDALLDQHGQSSFFGSVTRSVRMYCLQWRNYMQSPVFLASSSLSLLYLTVLSTGVQMTTWLLSIGFSSLEVSLMRLAAVAFELAATGLAPVLMRRIGPVRAGLWFINWQLGSLAAALPVFMYATAATKAAGISLMLGMIFSRLGLWGFDLSVQYLVQECIPESARGTFSVAEAAMQNLFELLTYASTMVFSEPVLFKYPAFLSIGAVLASSICYAAFVRQERGHLLHASRCMRRGKYTELAQVEMGDMSG